MWQRKLWAELIRPAYIFRTRSLHKRFSLSSKPSTVNLDHQPNTIQHYPTLPDTTWYYLTLSPITHHQPPLPIIFHHHLSSLTTTHYYPSSHIIAHYHSSPITTISHRYKSISPHCVTWIQIGVNSYKCWIGSFFGNISSFVLITGRENLPAYAVYS